MPTKHTKKFITGLVIFVRKQRGLSCKQFADLIQKDYNYIWKIEKGEKFFSHKYLDHIIQKLGYTILQFWAHVPAYIHHLETTHNKNIH